MNGTKQKSLVLVLLAVASLLLGLMYLFFVAASPAVPDYLFGAWRLRHVLAASVLFFVAAALFAAWIGRSTSVIFWGSCLPLLLLLVTLEVAGRAGLVDWGRIFGPNHKANSGPGWSLVPNTSVKGESYQDIAFAFGIPHDPIHFVFDTDSYGFRNDNQKDANILILGDSIVVGALVPKHSTVDSVIERAIGRPVMQAALIGRSIQEQHQMLRDSGLPLENRKIVQFFFEGNDLLDSYVGASRFEVPRIQNESLVKSVWALVVEVSNPRGEYFRCDIDGDPHYFLWLRNSFDGIMSEFETIENEILTFRQQVEELGASYSLVFVPTKYRVLHQICEFPEFSQIKLPSENLSHLPKVVSNWAKGENIEFLDLTAALQAAASNGASPWLWGDTHWSSEGHQISGAEIADWLKGN